MFYDDAIAGSWTAPAVRLDDRSTVGRWAARDPALSAHATSRSYTSCWPRVVTDGRRADEILGALVRLAAADGARDDDALLVLLHCLSGLASGLAHDLADLSDDIIAVVVGELTCQIRTYTRRGRTRAFAANLRFETRRAVLQDLRSSVRNHPEWGERLTDDGDTERVVNASVAGPATPEEDLDVVDLLLWAVRTCANVEGIQLLVATE